MRAYYNENDPFAAEWLRKLILFGHIAPGDVDTRSITEVRSSDLEGYRQCHFFAGIGVWSHALRRAGWEDDRPVWTGSCPCQPFSLAGKGAGFEDPRHLWPHWHRLIGQQRPVVCFGEQVASAGLWLDLVSSDLEALDYAVGAVSIPAAGFGGAHIRQRFFWVADARGAAGQWDTGSVLSAQEEVSREDGPVHGYSPLRSSDGGSTGGLVDAASEQAGLPGRAWESRGAIDGVEHAQGDGREPRRPESGGWGVERGCGLERLGDAGAEGFPFGSLHPDERGAIRIQGPAFGTTGALRGCDWLFCQDGKLRPVGPGTFPLAHAAPARVGRLRGYGNALDAETATRFIEAYMDI